MADYQYTVVLGDAFGRKVRRSYHIVAIDFASARTIADTHLAALQNLVAGGTLQDQLSEISALAGVPAAGSNVDEGVTFQWDLGSGKTASTTLPMVLKSVLNTDGTVDTADALVTAFAFGYVNGDIKVSDGETVSALIGGRLDK